MEKLQANEINFLKRLEESQNSHAGANKMLRTWLPLGILLVLVLSIWGYFFTQANYLNGQIDAADSYLADEERIMEYERSKQLQANRDSLNRKINNMADAIVNINTYPELSSDIYQSVIRTAGANIAILSVDYNRGSGYLYIQAVAESVTQAASFVDGLRTTGLFADLGYYGYNMSKEGSSTTYNFTVTTILPGEGADNE